MKISCISYRCHMEYDSSVPTTPCIRTFSQIIYLRETLSAVKFPTCFVIRVIILIVVSKGSYKMLCKLNLCTHRQYKVITVGLH